jgi:hypothetical protein
MPPGPTDGVGQRKIPGTIRLTAVPQEIEKSLHRLCRSLSNVTETVRYWFGHDDESRTRCPHPPVRRSGSLFRRNVPRKTVARFARAFVK